MAKKVQSSHIILLFFCCCYSLVQTDLIYNTRALWYWNIRSECLSKLKAICRVLLFAEIRTATWLDPGWRKFTQIQWDALIFWIFFCVFPPFIIITIEFTRMHLNVCWFNAFLFFFVFKKSWLARCGPYPVHTSILKNQRAKKTNHLFVFFSISRFIVCESPICNVQMHRNGMEWNKYAW